MSDTLTQSNREFAYNEEAMLKSIVKWRSGLKRQVAEQRRRGVEPQMKLRGARISPCRMVSNRKRAVPASAVSGALRESKVTEPKAVREVMDMVASTFELRLPGMLRRSNYKGIVRPRQIAMYLVRQHTGYSLPKMGAFFGGMHHTTVMYGVKKIEELRQVDGEIDALLMELEKNLGAARVAGGR